MHRYIGIRAQADEALPSNSSAQSSDTGIAAESGNSEAALVQHKTKQDPSGGPQDNPLIPQLFLFGR